MRITRISFGIFLSLMLFSGFSFRNFFEPDNPLSTLNGGLFLPEGFTAVVVVDSLPGKARHLTINDNGDIYVKARYCDIGESVVALRDTNGDGRADIIKQFGGNAKERGYGTGVRIYNGYLYFSSELVVYRYKLTPGDLIPKSQQEIVLIDDHPHGSHEHIAKPLTFDKEGHMYVAFGAPSNACQILNRTPGSLGIDPCPLLEDHAGIWRFDANQLNQKQHHGYKYATGLRSVVGMDWNKTDNSLYAVVHGRDDLLRLWPQLFSPWQSAMLPSEEFLKLKDGSNGGWPYTYYDQMKGKRIISPEYGGDGKKVSKNNQFEKPLIGFPGHWAPNDLLFYEGNQFPEHYQNGAFIAFHGSTNRAPYPQASYFIGFVPFKNNKPAGKYEIFADGFAGQDPIVNTNDAQYRPMGIAVGPDGSLYIAETEKGKIWKITYNGSKTKFGKTELAAMKSRKSLSHIRTPDKVKDNLDRGKPVAGEKVYAIYCGSCHQKNGKGDSQRFPTLAGSEWVLGDKNKLIEIVLNGLEGPIEVAGISYNGVMPQHSFLNDVEVAEVLTYIRHQFGNDAKEITAQEVALVRNKKITQ